MRQIISTAVVAVVVGAVAGATMGAVAQTGPEATTQQAIVPSVTSINAHKVDGRHAVSASASRKKRSGKLVATNKQGYLPNNIIKPAWKLIGGKPAAFADGQISWAEVVGKPAGFADGVDNADTTRSYIAATSLTYSSGQDGFLYITHPATLDLEVSLIPTGGGIWALTPANAAAGYGEEILLRSGDTIHHYFYFKNYSGVAGELQARVTVFNDGNLAPAAVKKRVTATFGRGSKVPRP